MSVPGCEGCVSCVFWEHQPDIYIRDGNRMGQCRANPPSTHVVRDKLVTRWPLTAERDYCGAHSTYEVVT